MHGSEGNGNLIKARKASFVASAASRQKGAYAVEFAFVFIAFFIVLYGMITYGLIFAAQQSMNFAAETGARAGLQWQAGSIRADLESEKSELGELESPTTEQLAQLANINTALESLEDFNATELVLLERAKRAWDVARYHSSWVNSMAKNTLQVTVCSYGVGVEKDGSYGACANVGSLEVVIHYPYYCKKTPDQECIPLVPYLGPSTLLQIAVPNNLESRSSVDLGIARDFS
ncbi:hypothetical protein GCM10011450_19460 [Advenella faeciporci]|uniref:TadE-like domain-containing protein n=1 Tax=Advenella faeciporci TaxID=797535 RepID=A0A918JP02_9BURK|nr:hypothetical protein GCM10011450_19460 [Advenella faeciporci]